MGIKLESDVSGVKDLCLVGDKVLWHKKVRASAQSALIQPFLPFPSEEREVENF